MRPSSRATWVASFLAFIFVLATFGCGKDGFVAPAASDKNEEQTIAVRPAPTPAPPNQELSICSSLSLKDVAWPLALDQVGKRSVALGLNISGSFEGGSGWKNITNNFDGQGLSLGLLNQCLGQGSLQPLMIEMRDRNNVLLRSQFTTAHYAALTGMLSKWQGLAKVAEADVSAAAVDGEGDEGLRPDGRLSDLDSLPNGSDGQGQQESASSDAVTWAKANLYTDGGVTFNSTWKKELQTMSGDPSYVSLQIEKALSIHNKAISYMKTLGLHQLRSYLFLFDVNVQNGGLYSSDIAAYKAAISSNSTADETTRLRKILDIRLTHVVAKFKNDVNARKLSIINGAGIVHGTSRNYPKEYCFTSTEKLM
jgi:hypothetical protein